MLDAYIEAVKDRWSLDLWLPFWFLVIIRCFLVVTGLSGVGEGIGRMLRREVETLGLASFEEGVWLGIIIEWFLSCKGATVWGGLGKKVALLAKLELMGKDNGD